MTGSCQGSLIDESSLRRRCQAPDWQSLSGQAHGRHRTSKGELGGGWLAPEAMLGMESSRGIEVQLPQVVRMS